MQIHIANCFKYLGSQVAADGGCEIDVGHRMKEWHKALEATKSALLNGALGLNAKKCLNNGIIVPTGLCLAEAWGMRRVERRKMNVLEMKCFRSLVRESQTDGAKNEEVRGNLE